MGEHTPETDFEIGAIYDTNPATYLATCPKCRIATLCERNTDAPVCGKCNLPLEGDRQQKGKRRYILLGSEEILAYDNTIPAVPLSAQEKAAMYVRVPITSF